VCNIPRPEDKQNQLSLHCVMWQAAALTDKLPALLGYVEEMGRLQCVS
jgi:hypothetical protein